MDNNNRLATDQFQVEPLGSRSLPKDYIDYSPDNKGNALALQDAVFGEPTDSAAIGGATAKLFSRLKGIQQNLESQTGLLQTSGTYQNKTILASYSSGGAPPPPLDLVATIDFANAPNNEWGVVTMVDFGAGSSANLGVSVSYDGSTWDDLYTTGTFNVEQYNASGSNVSGTSLSVSTASPVWFKSPFRYIRFVDQGTGFPYDLNIYSATDAPFYPEANQISLLASINSAAQYSKEEDSFYRALVAQPGVSPGDVIRRSSSSIYSQPNNPSFILWSNDTTGAVNIPAPALTGLVAMTVAEGGQNVTRLVNSNASSLQIKVGNTLLRSVYIDNLQAGIIYLGVHTGLSAAPVAGSVPIESYRIPSNGSVSIEFDRVYSNGQVWLSFSSTPGAITLSPNTKNVIARFN